MSTEAKRTWNREYLKQFKQVSLRFLPDQLEAVKAAADKAGESVAGYITKALDDRMNGGTISPEATEQARKAAEASGEDLRAWIGRAIKETAQRDEFGRLLRR